MRKLVEYGQAWHCCPRRSPGTAQAQIALATSPDYSGPNLDVGTPFGQGVADTYAGSNKNGPGINGAKVNVDTVDYATQVPRRRIAPVQRNGRAPTRWPPFWMGYRRHRRP